MRRIALPANPRRDVRLHPLPTNRRQDPKTQTFVLPAKTAPAKVRPYQTNLATVFRLTNETPTGSFCLHPLSSTTKAGPQNAVYRLTNDSCTRDVRPYQTNIATGKSAAFFSYPKGNAAHDLTRRFAATAKRRSKVRPKQLASAFFLCAPHPWKMNLLHTRHDIFSEKRFRPFGVETAFHGLAFLQVSRRGGFHGTS